MLRIAMPDTPDTPDTPDAPKKNRKIKLGLFIPWDETTGRLFNEERFIKPDAPPETKADNDSKIIPFPDSDPPKKDE
jgi:hypothetical protein